MSDTAESSCEGVKEGIQTILKRVSRIEKGLVAVAIMAGVQMIICLYMAIRYVMLCCNKKGKKLSRREREDEMEDEWQESVTKMENCLKTNKKVRKEHREEARAGELKRQHTAMLVQEGWLREPVST